jgi:hypothetical protein
MTQHAEITWSDKEFKRAVYTGIVTVAISLIIGLSSLLVNVIYSMPLIRQEMRQNKEMFDQRINQTNADMIRITNDLKMDLNLKYDRIRIDVEAARSVAEDALKHTRGLTSNKIQTPPIYSGTQ